MTKIINTTPWNTEDLEKFLLPQVHGCGIVEITVELMPPRPGRYYKRERLSIIRINNKEHNRLTVELLSPKRAAARAEMLDRLSLACDLKPHETALPPSVVAALEHGFEHLRTAANTKRGPAQGDHSYGWGAPTDARDLAYRNANEHMYGSCSCEFPSRTENGNIVRGDTKVKTQERAPITVEDLQAKLIKTQGLQKKFEVRAERARREADREEAKATGYKLRCEKLEERILKLQSKESMTGALVPHQGEEDYDDGDEDQQEDE